MSNEAFWKWFSAEQSELASLEPEVLAERLSDALRTHVGDLGVEVAEREAGEPLEVVFTADGDRARFDAVKALVASAPAIADWSFVPLKPAMGFEFILEADGVELDGSTLRFEPLMGAGGPRTAPLPARRRREGRGRGDADPAAPADRRRRGAGRGHCPRRGRAPLLPRGRGGHRPPRARRVPGAPDQAPGLIAAMPPRRDRQQTACPSRVPTQCGSRSRQPPPAQ